MNHLTRVCLTYPLNLKYLLTHLSPRYHLLLKTLKSLMYLCFHLSLCFRLNHLTRVYLMYPLNLKFLHFLTNLRFRLLQMNPNYPMYL